MRHMEHLAGSLLLIVLLPLNARGIDIVIDYRFDDNNFFSTQSRRDVLETVARTFELFFDELVAIIPGTVYNEGTPFEFEDTWEAVFSHPATGTEQRIRDPIVPAHTMIVYAGGRDISGTTLAQGAPGGFSVNGIDEFVDAVRARGQPGGLVPMPTDFGSWGGVISFDTNLLQDGSPLSWNFDIGSGPATDQQDFLSVAMHELGHVFGFSSAGSFRTWVNTTSNTFRGPASVVVHGGQVDLHPDESHWAEDTMSTIKGVLSETAMDRQITAGTRALFTDLDWAAFADIGWEMLADVDGSGVLAPADVGAFIQALAALNDESAFLAQVPDGHFNAADLDRNQVANNLDIGEFVKLMRDRALPAPPPPLLPEPATLMWLILAMPRLWARPDKKIKKELGSVSQTASLKLTGI